MLREDHTEDKVYENPNDKYTGYCAELTEELAGWLGINFEIRPVKDGKYGSKDENDTWNGMVGELVRNVRIVCYLINVHRVHLYVHNITYIYIEVSK